MDEQFEKTVIMESAKDVAEDQVRNSEWREAQLKKRSLAPRQTVNPDVVTGPVAYLT